MWESDVIAIRTRDDFAEQNRWGESGRAMPVRDSDELGRRVAQALGASRFVM
jgi:hypothetical protein